MNQHLSEVFFLEMVINLSRTIKIKTGVRLGGIELHLVNFGVREAAILDILDPVILLCAFLFNVIHRLTYTTP